MARARADLTSPDVEEARKRRVPEALFRIAERHGASAAARARTEGAATLAPAGAVRLVELLGAGTAGYRQGEDAVDPADLLDALTLLPLVKAELAETELTLMVLARGRGLTWAQIADGLGLRSAQAAQQRFDRLRDRLDDAD